MTAFAVAVSSVAFDTVRDSAMDRVLELRRAPPSPVPITVVDIDRISLAALGNWPWSRERLAELVSVIATSQPRVIGLDILIDGPDERSPAALARKLAEAANRPELALLAATLADGDVALGAALRTAPSVVGVALDPDNASDTAPPPPAILARGAPDLGGVWRAAGAIGPVAGLAESAAGFGILALSGDSDARVRHVPLLVIADDQVRPGLALEVARLANQAAAYILEADPPRLRLGGLSLDLTYDASLRLRPIDEQSYATRTLSAVNVMRDASVRQRLAGGIVLIGASAPEVGGLRASVSGPLVPTVQIQADAVAQIMSGDNPRRTQVLIYIEVVALIIMAALAAWIATRQPPVIAAAVTIGIAALWIGVVVIAHDAAAMLLDPVTPPLGAAAAFAISAFLVASQLRVREAAIRRRFEQHLPAAVVRRMLAEPGLLKLAGEARQITALFTDIEGFTAMTERAGPRVLVQLLDRYFDGVTRIVVEHEGMVEKIVGDGLHAIFNAPLDLAAHPAKAVACAEAIQVFAERFRADGDARRLDFGPTRIGIETGDVIIGDVGGGRRLDYTAHGDVMNTASRLEAANKALGSRICIGPVAAATLDRETLRPLGALAVRGRSVPLDVYEPWPADMPSDVRRAYRVAIALIATDVERAIAALAELSQLCPTDRVISQRYTELKQRSERQL